MRWIEGRPGMRYGYMDMGRIDIPPQARHIVLTDRTDGTKWWLTFNTTISTPDGFGYISITDTAPPNNPSPLVFPAYEEPYLKTQTGKDLVRLIVDNGYLGVDDIAPTHIVNEGNLRVTATSLRTSFGTYIRDIVVSTTIPGEYAWVPSLLAQIPNP